MEFMTRNEVAKYFRVHARTVERWLQNGELKGYKLGTGKTALWRISKGEVELFMNKHQNNTNDRRKSKNK